MSDMKHVNKRVVTVEDHAVTVSLREVLELAVQDDPERSAIGPHDTQLQVVLGVSLTEGREVLAGSTLLDLLRASNEDIPENAEIVVGVRWRKETEVSAPRLGVVPSNVQAQTAQTIGQLGVDPSHVVVCSTCGAVPALQGPTPECVDPNGCGMLRVRFGQMPIPQAALPPPGAPGAPAAFPGMGSLPTSPGLAINRETGEKAFIAKDGSLYGKHDYLKDRLAMRDI